MAVLETEGISKTFGGLVALNGVTLQFRENEVLGIIGPNGAGKSTLINVLAGVYAPTQGVIRFLGRDITPLPPHRRFQIGIGRTFQLMRPLQHLTLVENVMIGAMFGKGLGLRASREASEGICGFMGLRDLDRDLSRLTALEIKKMEMARALVAGPRVLFLDEIMAGLTTDEILEMIALVKEVRAQGLTIGIIEHVMGVIKELTDRVVVLDWGQVLAEGPYAEVSNDPRVITAYLGEEAACST